MTKYSFLNELDQLLGDLPADERREILEDYEEHFAFARRADKSDDDVIKLVGLPEEIANEILERTVEGNSPKDIAQENEAQKKELEAQAEALEAQAKILEAKLAAQAEALEAKAEALEAKLEAREKTRDVETFVENVAAKAGEIVESISGAIAETFDTQVETPLENAAQSKTSIEEIIDMTGVKNVIIKAYNQKVGIEKTTYPTARVRLTKGILATRVDGDTLFVEARDMKRKFGIGIFINFDPTPELTIELPESVYHLIQTKTTNAKIEIESFVLDKLDLKSENGKLEVLDIKADAIRLKTTNSKIQMENIEGNVAAQTTNGKIELERITGDIEAKTTNGKIEFENTNINQNVMLSTTNAKIEVSLQHKPQHATFELSTSNAKTELFDTDRNYDVLGDGHNKIKLITTNAKISVNQEMDWW